MKHLKTFESATEISAKINPNIPFYSDGENLVFKLSGKEYKYKINIDIGDLNLLSVKKLSDTSYEFIVSKLFLTRKIEVSITRINSILQTLSDGISKNGKPPKEIFSKATGAGKDFTLRLI